MVKKKILFLGAHCDDVEFGCGGTISKLVGHSNKYEIQIRVLSNNLVSHDGTVVHERDLSEQKRAMHALGIGESNYVVENISGGQVFPENRQKILDFLYELKTKINPDLIFTTSFRDIHQDHRTLFEATNKAFNRKEILAYTILNSCKSLFHPINVAISKKDLDSKIQSINCYKSMMSKELSLVDYFDRRIIESDARVNGLKAGVEFAESFEPVRLELFE